MRLQRSRGRRAEDGSAQRLGAKDRWGSDMPHCGTGVQFRLCLTNLPVAYQTMTATNPWSGHVSSRSAMELARRNRIEFGG